MKKNLLKKLASMMGVVVLLFTLTACPPKDPCKNVQKPDDNRTFGEQVHAYLEHYQEEEEKSRISNDRYAAYFDLSDGMEYAFNSAYGGEKELLTSVVDKLFTKECEIWGLKDGQLESMNGKKKDEVREDICEKTYNRQEAPIEKALKQIAEQKKPALLVTDFEEYDKEAKRIVKRGYAYDYFNKWVVDYQGVIQFYTLNFKEKQLEKKLFFVVFDNKDKRFISDIYDVLRRSGKEFGKFTLESSSYNVYNKYPVGKGGNFFDSDGVDPLEFKVEVFNDLNAETYYNMDMLSWLQIAETLMPYRLNPDEKFKGLLSNLYIDNSNPQSCYIKKFDVKVTDITEDFNSFTNNQYALSAVDAPDKSEDGNVTLECVQKFFYDADGKLFSEYQYKQVNPKDVTNFLEINQEMFKDNEIVIDFGKEYTDNTMYDEDRGVYYLKEREDKKDKVNGRILRVDVYVAKRERGTDYSGLREFFDFNSFQRNNGVKTSLDEANTCISNSVNDVLDNLVEVTKPTVVYTYILKDCPDAYVARKK